MGIDENEDRGKAEGDTTAEKADSELPDYVRFRRLDDAGTCCTAHSLIHTFGKLPQGHMSFRLSAAGWRSARVGG